LKALSLQQPVLSLLLVNTINTMMFPSSLLLLSMMMLLIGRSVSYAPTPYLATVRSSLSMAKRGRGSFQNESGMSIPNPEGKSGGIGNAANDSGINWCPVPPGQKLPEKEGVVTLMDTMLTTLKNGATNPTGAVGVVKYAGQTYCFSSACPSCKIPLVKAKVFPGDVDAAAENKAPRLACDFCKSTYNLKSGNKVAAVETGGFFGNIVKSVMQSQATGGLPIYKLGEKNGKLLICVDR
jgi:nitrite reductase/ring-hydroxylating ferredoxin subunit